MVMTPLKTPPQHRTDGTDHRQRHRRVPVSPRGENEVDRP
jgi:hypothetical protein